MMVFYAMATVMIVSVIYGLGRVLLRATPAVQVSSQRLNAAIYRDQLHALERDRTIGVISDVDYETTRSELQLRLLDETQDAGKAATRSPTYFWTPRLTFAVVAILISVGGPVLYAWLGNAGVIVGSETSRRPGDNSQILQMVDALASRLEANPDNPKGWAMLARSYKVLGRFEDAEKAYLKAGTIINSDPELMVDYADLLAIRANSIDGKPLELVNQALQIDPFQPTGLMMSGVAAYRRGDFALAIRQWEKLLTVLEPGSSDAQQVAADIAQAKTKTDLKP